MSEIVNRVAQSKLITFNLEDYYPKGNRMVLDIKDWLFEEMVLREQEFRSHVENHDWEQYQDSYVALHCSVDAIVPGWAYLLLSSKAIPFAKKVVVGQLEDLESAIFQELLQNMDISEFVDKPVIIKGCSNKPVPQNAFIFAIEKIQPIAQKIMYGEACSFVPLFKRK